MSSTPSRRILVIGALAIVLGGAAGLVAQALMHLIGLVTNLAFYGRFATTFISPADNHLGAWVIVVPVIGGLIVGVMARYGSAAIRGHGIPEAMEQILINESRVPARITWLKPVSAAIAIGTGGPFGAEGPIIATGGALGSLIGQLMRTTADERKTLLAAGAAAGMTATFGSPVSAVLLAVELLLFEYRTASLVPVAFASVTAAAVRLTMVGSKAIFAMPDLVQVHGSAIAFYIVLGAVVGVASVVVTRVVYWIEDTFDHLPVHWMWWPAIGGVAVGLVGYVSPHTLGVGYDNIENIIGGTFTGQAMLVFCLWKFVSWAISLGSGTSGGTLAPLFTIGGGMGAAIALGFNSIFPGQGVDPRIGALVGMAAIFSGASRAMLASAVFAFETTHQPIGLLPLLGGCTASGLVSAFLMPNTIMTEKIVRRGVSVPSDYQADYLAQVRVGDHCSETVVSLAADETVAAAREKLAPHGHGRGTYAHQGFPVLAKDGALVGLLTRRDLLDPEVSGEKKLSELTRRQPIVIGRNRTLREAVDMLTRHEIGRLPVVDGSPVRVIGMLTRSDIIGAHARQLREREDANAPSLRIALSLAKTPRAR